MKNGKGINHFDGMRVPFYICPIFSLYLTIYKVTITHFIRGYFSFPQRDSFLSLWGILFFPSQGHFSFHHSFFCSEANITEYKKFDVSPITNTEKRNMVKFRYHFSHFWLIATGIFDLKYICLGFILSANVKS